MGSAFATTFPYLGNYAGRSMTAGGGEGMNDPRENPRLRRRNLLLAWLLGIFAVLVMLYSMRFIWPHVDIFSR